MTRTRDKVALIGLLVLGAWGCGRTPATADVQKKQLEARTAKLEADLADATARLNEAEQNIAREQARSRAAERTAAEKLAKEHLRGQALERERNDLYARFKAAADQRDATQTQFESFVKKIEGVLTETKAAMGRPGPNDKTDATANTSTAAARAGGY